jgi:hypothetical protein
MEDSGFELLVTKEVENHYNEQFDTITEGNHVKFYCLIVQMFLLKINKNSIIKLFKNFSKDILVVIIGSLW